MITAAYMGDLSRVRVTGSGLAEGTVTVERSLNGLLWETVRGGAAVEIGPAGTLTLDDYEFVPGLEYTYRVRAALDHTWAAPSADQTWGDPWTVPAGVRSIYAASTGAGGDALTTGTNASAGAGGGAWVGSLLAVTPGERLGLLVGSASYTGTVHGRYSAVIRDSTILQLAPGGSGVTSAGTPGAGGVATSPAVGDTVHAGGAGGARQGTSTAGGGGGASASPTGAGKAGAAGSSGTGGAGGVGNADTVAYPQVTGVVHETSGTTGTWNVTAPAGDLNGQVLLLIHAADVGEIADMGTPTGGATWTLMEDAENLDGVGGGVARLWWKVAGAAEPATYGLTQNPGADGTAAVIAVSGVNTSGIAADATASTSGSGTNLATPQVAIAAPGGLDVRIGAVATWRDITAPAGWTALVDDGTDYASVGVAVRERAAGAGSAENMVLDTGLTEGRFGATVTLPGFTSVTDGGNGPGGNGGNTGASGLGGGAPGGGGGGRGGGNTTAVSGRGAHGQIHLHSWPGGATETTTITPVVDRVWLTCLRYPLLNRPVRVGGVADDGRVARVGVFEVKGRSVPVVVSDRRASPAWTLTLRTTTLEEARDLDLALAVGSEFYLQVPPGLQVPGGHIAVGDVAMQRFGPVATNRRWTLPCRTIAAPAPEVLPATLTWRTVLDTYGSWQALLAANPTWADLLDGIGSPEDLVTF